VFQAFFVSYLDEPGYGEKFETFQDLLDSNVGYGVNTAVEFALSTSGITGHMQFPFTRHVNCNDIKTCHIRLITDGDVAIISSPSYAQYLSNEFGHQGEMKSLCYLDENLLYGNIVALFAKGNPLVNQFNQIIRRCLEGGLGEKYWAELNHEALLSSRTKSDEVGSSMYFVFTLSHMVPAFSVLGFGYLFSTIVCIAECLHKRFTK
jgi:hypothetical protein